MLDKSIPYAEIWMKRAHKSTPIQPAQSDNYSLRSYQAGDERHWARIETSVGEFDNEAEALAYFEKEFMPEQAQLGQRMFLPLINQVHRSVRLPLGKSQARRHTGSTSPLVAVMPQAQRQGIARGLVTQVVSVLEAANEPMYLHTQTWSHAAITLYQQLGFVIIATDINGNENPEYPLACQVLAEVAQKPETSKRWRRQKSVNFS